MMRIPYAHHSFPPRSTSILLLESTLPPQTSSMILFFTHPPLKSNGIASSEAR